MKRNVGGCDRAARILLGILLCFIGYLGYFGPFPAWGAVPAYIVGGISLLTGLFGVCPLYQVLGIDTCATTMKERFSSR